MNKIYKTVFNKKTGKLVVANELKSAMRKGASVISMTVLAVVLLQPIEPYAGVANGFYINSIFTGPNGQEILNLNNLGNAMNNNGPTVGDGSIGAGENAVSFGAGEYWKPLGDLSKPQFFINKLQVDRGSGAYDGVQWLRGSYWVVGYDEKSQAVAIKEINVNTEICSGWSDCQQKGYSSWANRNLTSEEQIDLFGQFVNTSGVNIDDAVTKWTAVMQRKLVNVAPGEVSATSTDAVNGSQLYELQEKIGSGGSEYLSVNATDNDASPSTSAKAVGARSTAVGESATATGTRSVAIGYQSTAEADGSIALGSESKALQSDLVSGDTHGVVSVGSASQNNGFTRRIINVADGVRASDAATVGQIDKAAKDLLGVSVSRDDAGKLTAGDLGQTGKTTVSDAIGAVKTSVDAINNGTFGEGAKTSVTQIAQQAAQTAVEVTSADGRLVVGSTQADDKSKTTYALSINADGAVASDNTGLVTGGTVFTETRPTDGTYVLSSATAGANLNALDRQVKNNADTLSLKADASLGNLTVEGKRVVSDLIDVKGDNAGHLTVGSSVDENGIRHITLGVNADGTVGGANDNRLVTGSTVATETRVSEDGIYIKADNSAAENLLILDGQIASKADTSLGNLTVEGKKVVSGLIDVKGDDTGHLAVDASVDEDGVRHITLGVNADGTVGGVNDGGIVTGETVEQALDDSVQNILTNITMEGSDFHKAIRSEAKDAVKIRVADGEEALLLTSTSTENDTTYTLGLKFADTLEEGGALPVSSGLVFTELGKLANAEITVENVNAWQQKLGDGKVAQGNTGLVTGGTVADAIRDSLTNLEGTEAGGAIVETAQRAINVKAADGQTLLTVSKATEGPDGSNLDTYTIDLLLAESLADEQAGLITAEVLRTEVRPAKDGEHVSKNNTVGDNLLALDASLSGVSGEVDSLRNFENLTATGVKNLNTHVANAFTIEAADSSPLSISSNVNGQTGAKTWTIDVNDAGKIADGDTNLVTGDTVWEYVKDFTTGAGFASVDASNITVESWHAKLGTQAGSPAISQVNSAFVSGKEVFDEVRVPATSSESGYSYLNAGNTTAENLIALDKGLNSLRDLSDLTDEGRDEIGSIAADAVKLTAGSHTVVTQDEATKAWTIGVIDTGKVAENDAELVTGGTVWTYVTEATTGLATVDAGNIRREAWLATLGTPADAAAIAATNTRFVTGAEIYAEVRPQRDGYYIAQDRGTGDNLLALDKSLHDVNSTVFDADGNLLLSKNDLSNLTDAGKSVIAQSAQDAVKVSSESAALVVTPKKDAASTNYVLSLKTSDQEGADASSLVTSGTLDEALASQSGEFNEELTTSLAGKADIDAGNITGENLTAWQTTLASDAAASAGNAGLVSGGMLFMEVRPTADGRFVRTGETTATNLSALDEGLGKVAAADVSVIDRDNWIGSLSGSISAGVAGSGFITGNALYSWTTPATGNFTAISSGNSVAQNLVALDAKLGEVQQGSIDTSLGNLTDAGKDVIADIAAGVVSVTGSGAIKVEETADGQFVVSVDTGDVVEGGNSLVTGGDVWDAIQNAAISDDELQNIVNEAISNNETFEAAINQAVSNNENIQNAISNALTNKETVEHLSVAVATGEIKADDNHAVSGGTVYNYLHGSTVAFGANASATGEHAVAIGTDAVASGRNSGAIGYGSNVAAENSFAVGSNNKLDEKAQNTFVLGSNVTTSAQNAVVLGHGSEGVDNAVSVGSSTNKRKIVNVAAGDVYEGSTDAVNGGQLYETNQAIAETARSINHVAQELQEEINRAAANSAALAALHPLGLDEDHKWSAAAGVGHYQGEQALAIGVFYKPTENVMVNVAGSSSTGGDTMMNAGVSYRFGAPSSYNSMTNSELKGKVLALSTQNDALQAQLESARIREDGIRLRMEKSQKALEELMSEIELLKEAVGLKKTTSPQVKAVKVKADAQP